MINVQKTSYGPNIERFISWWCGAETDYTMMDNSATTLTKSSPQSSTLHAAKIKSALDILLWQQEDGGEDEVEVLYKKQML